MKSLRSLVTSVVVVAVMAGCGAPFRASPPAGFVELEDQDDHGYDFRATSPDGLVFSVRVIKNEPRGDQTFWSQAVSNRMRDKGGYALLDRREVKAKTGHAGVQFRFGHDEGRAPHLYWLTLFVTTDQLFVLEAGGEKKLFEASADKADAFVASFVVK